MANLRTRRVGDHAPNVISFQWYSDAGAANAGSLLGRDSASQVGRLRVKGDVKIVDGDPTTEILSMVQEQSAELLVVGTRGRSSVSRVMLGSVAASVLQRAPCSVLAVRLATG